VAADGPDDPARPDDPCRRLQRFLAVVVSGIQLSGRSISSKLWREVERFFSILERFSSGFARE